jgi:hypothetical protein
MFFVDMEAWTHKDRRQVYETVKPFAFGNRPSTHPCEMKNLEKPCPVFS